MLLLLFLAVVTVDIKLVVLIDGVDIIVKLLVGLLIFAFHISGPHFVVFVDDDNGGVNSNLDLSVFLPSDTGDCGGVSNEGAYLIILLFLP